ncbi:permease [Pleomorphomonas koreensis]|uniref:permease n=1 Tax=Pleomorphomonas koreensis TaxID=257440 RepID=UPI0003FACDB6|nr:permease [Pleomorphomonas koreensis]
MSTCCPSPSPAPRPSLTSSPAFWYAGTGLGLAVWVLLYELLQPFATWAVAQLPVAPGSHLEEALAFFLYDTPKVLMLLTLVVFGMGIVRSFFSGEATRRLLAGKREGLGNVAAASLGIVTPFCSCSAVPLFIGFVSAGVPLGVTFSFLIAAPMVNEVALGLLFALMGWQVALSYLGFGLGIAILAGWVIGRFHLESWLQPWVLNVRMGATQLPDMRMTAVDRIQAGLDSVKDIVGKVWLWVIAGISIGALIHGYAPADLLASIMGKDAWWSVPAAVVIGIPMYSNAAGIIPVVEALLGKGAAIGTVLAFMMAVIALSLPEMIILKKVLTGRLIAVFVGVVGLGIVAVGYLFNAVFAG